MMRHKTHQQSTYESRYLEREEIVGFPDRKIGAPNLGGRRILSLGCGFGNDVWHLAGDNVVVGMDYARAGLSVGALHGVLGVLGNLDFSPTLPFESRTFDVVVCKDILEHLLDPMALLKEARRVLKDDGYAVVSVPNHFFLPFRLRILLGRGLLWRSIDADHEKDYDEWNYMHIRFFTYRGFLRFLREAEFCPERWFWDFGELAHYKNPDMWLEPQLAKKAKGQVLSPRGQAGVTLLAPLWHAFNLVLPRRLRSLMVSFAPGLLCAGFYVWIRKA